MRTAVCNCCGGELEPYAEALNRKLIHRAAKEFLCYGCLAEYFQVSRQTLEERVAFFRENGCALFK